MLLNGKLGSLLLAGSTVRKTAPGGDVIPSLDGRECATAAHRLSEIGSKSGQFALHVAGVIIPPPSRHERKPVHLWRESCRPCENPLAANHSAISCHCKGCGNANIPN